MAEEKIHFILTGGTIDFHYEGAKDGVVANDKSVIPKFLESVGLDSKRVETTELFMKDSRALTEADVKTIAKVVGESPSKKIIITHGTYTMPDTARYLKAHLPNTDKIIVLTGSMVPIVGMAPSDGPFQLGFAIAKVRELKPGVYACINATVFSPEEIAKNIAEGKFYSVFGEK